MVTFSAHALPVQYFPDHFELVSSIIMTAGGLGMMVLPVIAEQLSLMYGWRQTMMLLGAFSLHNIPIGALLKPLGIRFGEVKVPRKDTYDIENPAEEHCSAAETECLLDSASISREDLQLEESPSGIMNNTPDHVSYKEALNMPRKSLTESYCSADEMKSILESPSVSKADADIQLMESTNGVATDTDIADETSHESVWESFKIMIGFDIVQKKPDVLSVIFAMFMLGFSYSAWIVFLVPNSVAKGHPIETSVILATIGGATNIFGRFSIGFVSKWQLFSNHTIFLMLSLVSAVAYAMNNISSGFWALSVLAILNGSTLGAMTAMINILSRDSAPDGDVAGVISLLLMALGAGLPVGGFVVGNVFGFFKFLIHAFSTVQKERQRRYA